MGFQRENRLEIRVLRLCRFLTSVLLAASLVLPAPALHTLSCYYCPLQKKNKSCANVTSQCSANQYCASSRGYYGAVHVLSARGCVDEVLCDSHEVTTYRGAKYNVTHTCCYKNTCNKWPKSDSMLKKLLGMSPHKTDVNISHVLREDLQDSFNNYTTSAPNTTGERPQTLI